jgi:hypothetical protein
LNPATPGAAAIGAAGGQAPASNVPVGNTIAPGSAGTGAATPPQSSVTPPKATDPATTTPPAAGETPWPADCETHYKLMIYSGTVGTKYKVGPGQEVHPQISIAPPWKGDVQAVAFRPITDNHRILHHWILNSSDGAFLTGWAPGADGTKEPLPLDVGMYLPATGNMRMDVHYNNLTGTATEEDMSGVEVCVISTPSKFRKNTATVVGISGNATAPAHQRVDNATTCTVTASMGTATLVTNSPHMHQLGVHAKLELKQGGVSTILHDDDFSFDNQVSYAMNPRIVVKTGDQFTVTCSYQNNTDKNVTFGQNTSDEMCFNFVSVYPKGGFSCRPAGGGVLPTPTL